MSILYPCLFINANLKLLHHMSCMYFSDSQMTDVNTGSDVAYEQAAGIVSSHHEEPTQSTDSSGQSAIPSSLEDLTTREGIHEAAQQLVEDLNNKRKQDTDFLHTFKKAVESNVRR